MFNRLGEKQEADKAWNDGISSIVKKSTEKTLFPSQSDSKSQKVILVQRVPAKAIFHEESKSSSKSHLKCPREKSVSFSEKDEILEIHRYNIFLDKL